MATGVETILSDNAFLVSETDAKGIIIFANEEFCNVAEYTKDELVGKSHNYVRHEDMPKAAFEDLWKTVKAGSVWQGFVKNKTASGGFYWVYATVYPYKNEANEQCYMSIRRKPSRENINKYTELYKSMV
ncbi:PAS domain-containing protein [Arcobacter arenosus]|jgi:aerotaxis receptor|uniref:PAS domain-containing protein n=1 Tax=Arcobacter arenosus TaxID=2576037 RepID=A0A5R8Y4E2_9BACT|nr:PAS domain-containing protein [Arcobacter arenosus]TLP40838.1 PAS domain-containing protein [Arcobacter arenosus]